MTSIGMCASCASGVPRLGPSWQEGRALDLNRRSTCVEVAINLPAVIAVRDSQHTTGFALVIIHAAWRAFTSALQAPGQASS